MRLSLPQLSLVAVNFASSWVIGSGCMGLRVWSSASCCAITHFGSTFGLGVELQRSASLCSLTIGTCCLRGDRATL